MIGGEESFILSGSLTRAAAIVRKNRKGFALQVAILKAAVGVEVGVLGKINAHGTIDMVVLEGVAEISHAAVGGITPNGGQIVPAVRLNRVLSK